MRQNDPPNTYAKMTRQNILLWKSAGFTRENNPPNLLARKTCHFNSRLACQRTPFPAQNPRGKTWPAIPPPPPHGSANGVGEGAGSRPGPPTHIEQVLFLSFHISWMITYSCTTQHIHILHRADWMKYKYIAVGEGIIARRGWGAGLLPAPLKGVFCIF
jgi:hypothetical protein